MNLYIRKGQKCICDHWGFPECETTMGCPAHDPEVEKIENLTHEEMGRLVRFHPTGHLYFQEPYYDIFSKRFKALGGMTPELSKHLGWEE